MLNNDILRRLQYALSLNEIKMHSIFKLTELNITSKEIYNYIKKEEDPEFVLCPDLIMDKFLDGLIIFYRGKKDNAQSIKPAVKLTNNVILKKLRIALQLKDDDILSILKSGLFEISKSELSAIFRKEGQRNYKECKDQLLRKFLKGLTIKHRNTAKDIS